MGTIAVVGLGYVGFPLAVEFGKVRETIGFDPAEEKVESYKQFVDPTGELPDDEIRAALEQAGASNLADLDTVMARGLTTTSMPRLVISGP